MERAVVKGFWHWINTEKAVFLLAAAWLTGTGVGFQGAPVILQWGAPRVNDASPEYRPVKLGPPPPIGEFLAGARGSPFAEVERTALVRSGQLPTWRPPKPARIKQPNPKPKPTPKPRPKPPPPPRPKPPAGNESPGKPKPYDLPMRWVGRIADRFVFEVKEDGRYLSVKEGQELPGLGVKVVSTTKSVVIVENEEGVRFRLIDLLRAKAEGD